MRWFTSDAPPVGSRRVVEGFLWLPMKLGLETRWLETTKWVEIKNDSGKWIPLMWYPEEIGNGRPEKDV